MIVKTEFVSPQEYSMKNPIHMAIYSYNGIGKTTLAGKSGEGPEFSHSLRTVLLDCGDAGAVTLRHVSKKLLRIVRIKSCLHYLDVINDLITTETDIDLLVPDTITGLQTLAIREVKGKRNFEMNKRKWGLVSSRVIECLAETRNFPRDVIYLVQERRNTEGGDDSAVENIMPSLTPSIRAYLSTCVDWVGWLSLTEGARTLDFRITENLEAKDRAGLFPKLIKNPRYAGIRNRIITQLTNHKESDANAETNNG